MITSDETDPITFEWEHKGSNSILTVSQYVEDFVEALKDTVPPSSRSWDPIERTWTISADWVDEVQEIAENCDLEEA